MNGNTLYKKRRAMRKALWAAGNRAETEEIRERARLLRGSAGESPSGAVKSTLKEMDKTVREMDAAREKAFRAIQRLTGTEYEIFSRRYIYRQRWENIAAEMHYTRESLAYRERETLNRMIWEDSGQRKTPFKAEVKHSQSIKPETNTP